MPHSTRSASRRICRGVLSTCAILLASALAAPALAQPSGEAWEAYQQRLRQQRQQSAERYSHWHGGRDERYESWRQPLPEDRRPDDIFDLFDGDVPSGQYYLDLPFGRIGVNVQRRPDAPSGPPGAWGPGNYHSAYELVDKLQEPLRDLHILFERAGHQELRNQVLDARTQSEELKNALAARAAPETIARQYEEFDRIWHPVFFHVSQRQDLGAVVQRRAENVRDYDNLLHQVIRIGPAEPYDRLRVAGLARQLAVATEHLLDDVDREMREYAWVRSIGRNAERVHRHAQDLYQTVHENAGFVAVQEEFAQFDRAWHDFVERVPGRSGLSRSLRETIRQVWQIDNALHEALYVDNPLPGDGRTAARLAAQIERTAEHLVEDLRYEDGRDARWLMYDARQLARSARRLGNALEGGYADDVSRGYDELIENWRHLSADLDRLGRDASPHTRRVVEELGGQIAALSRALDVGRGPG